MCSQVQWTIQNQGPYVRVLYVRVLYSRGKNYQGSLFQSPVQCALLLWCSVPGFSTWIIFHVYPVFIFLTELFVIILSRLFLSEGTSVMCRPSYSKCLVHKPPCPSLVSSTVTFRVFCSSGFCPACFCAFHRFCL